MPLGPWPCRLCHTLGRRWGGLELLPPWDRESCKAQQERMKRCSDSTGRHTQEADKVQSNVHFCERLCTGTHTMYNLISLLFCPLRELHGILTSARGGPQAEHGSPPRQRDSSTAQYCAPGICEPGTQQRGAPTAATAMSPPSAVTRAVTHASSRPGPHSALASFHFKLQLLLFVHAPMHTHHSFSC